MLKQKKYNILQAASWYTIGNILIKGVAFFVLPIFTRLMSTYEYGIYGVYTSYLSIFEVIVLLGMSATIAVARYAKEVEFDSYVSTAITIPIILVGICSIVINICVAAIGPLFSMDAILWNCLFVNAACGAVNNIISAKLVIEGRYRIYMGYSTLYTLGNVGLSLVLCYTIYSDHNAHMARVFGSTMAAILSMAYLLVLTKIKFTLNRTNLRYALVWGVPLLFHTLATVVLTQSDRIIIRYMDSYSSAGIYAIATTIVTIPMVLQSSLSQAWQPWFFDHLEKCEYERIRWLNNRYIVSYATVIALFMLVSPEIIMLFTEKSYWNSVYSLIPLSISIFGEMIYSIPTAVEYYYKKTNYIMVGTITTVIINIILDIAFIYIFGYVGAAYATAISKIILFCMHCFFMRKIEKNHVFNISIVGCMLLLLGLINILTVAFTNMIVLRYVIIGVIAIVGGCYVFRMKDKIGSYI